jgi:hypothetical protein
MSLTKFADLVLLLSALLISGHVAVASEYCSKEQYQRDRALIENAISAGTIVKGPKGLRDSVLVSREHVVWDELPSTDRLHAIFRMRHERAGGKKLLYMDVRSLATGKLFATWAAGVLKPSDCVQRTAAFRAAVLAARWWVR